MTRNIARAARVLALSALMGVMAAGCSHPLYNSEEQAIQVDQRFPITVEPQMTNLNIYPNGANHGLSADDRARVVAFAERWKARGQGAITVAIPQGGADGLAGEHLAHHAVKALASAGVPRANIQTAAYPAHRMPGGAPVTISYVGLTAVAPDCSELGWEDNLGFAPRNMPWNNFGCATQNNLAAMVNNPRDLIEPRPTDDVDVRRRMKVVDDFRNAKPTATKRQQEESGNVSAAAKGTGGQ